VTFSSTGSVDIGAREIRMDLKCLVVEPDLESATMHPLFKVGRPSIVYLCREEREA
jgi:hypothetical protein